VRIKARLMGLFGATAIASGLLAAAPVSAQDFPTAPISDVIIFQGCTPHNGVVPPVQPAGGGGNYSFNAPCPATDQFSGIAGFCLGVSEVDSPDLNVANEIGPCSLNAPGTDSYTNTVCGTGSTGGGVVAALTGAGTDTANVNAEGASPYVSIQYGIAFFGGVGVVRGVATGSGALAGDQDTGGLVVGVVVLTPTNGNCVTPVAQFYATGVALITEPSTGS